MDWKVPFINYPAQYDKVREELLSQVDAMLRQGDVMLRQQLSDFEDHLAAFVGTKYAVGTSNCTDGLHLVLRASGFGSGDEVITVAHTFVATAAAIHHSGAVPVLVDIGDDHNMDVDLLERAITPRTKAIMPVHLNGRLSEMAQVVEIAQQHGLAVIEDTAQALGASLDGKNGGNWGLAGCFSFYPAKLLGTYGDAGAVVTNSEELAESIKLLRNHGRMPDGDVSGWSFNCRMDNLHALILDLKLRQVPMWIERRRAIAEIYQDMLSDISELLLPPPPADGGRYHDVFQNYEIETEGRDQLRQHLDDNRIETMIAWGGRAVHQYPALGLGNHRLPRTERLMEQVLCLPMHCELSDEQVAYTAGKVRSFFG